MASCDFFYRRRSGDEYGSTTYRINALPSSPFLFKLLYPTPYFLILTVMKALRDMGWPHLKPTENLHSTRSNPSLKASPTVSLHPERVNGSDLSFRRSSEGACGSDEPVRELSPRPEPDSRIVTPKLARSISEPETEPEFETNITAPEPHSPTVFSEFDSKGPTTSKLTKELKEPQLILSAPSEDGKENFIGVPHLQQSPPPSVSAKEASASLEGLQLAVTAMGLRGSGTISPLSNGSLSDLIQSMPDSPVSEHPSGQMQADFKWKTSKRISRIDVSENSTDEPSTAFLPLMNASNTASTFPTIRTVASNHPVMIIPEIQQRMFDGPASIAAVTKDFSHALGDCPPVSETAELHEDTALPLKIEGIAKVFPEPLVAKNSLPLSIPENMPTLYDISLKHKLSGVPDMPGVPAVPLVKPQGVPSLLQIPVMPGLPIDVTGLASIPASPLPNLNKKQKLKIKGQRAIRRGRRLVMRRSVMTVLLGRQLAGPTVAGLKLISETERVTVSPTTSATPVPMPM